MTKLMDLCEQHFIFNGYIQPISEFKDDFVTGEKVIYEVIQVIDSAPIFLNEHIARMEQSIKLSNLAKIDFELLQKSIRELLRENPVNQQNIKIVAAYKSLTGKADFSVFFIPSKYPNNHDKLNGVSVKTTYAARQDPEVKSENKTLRSYADNVIVTCGCYEVLLINELGLITEGSRSNVFFIKNDKLITAPLGLVLGGITLLKVIDICNKLGIELIQNALSINQIAEIDGGFISGTSPGILAINKIDDIKLDVNIDLIKKVSAEYENLVLTEIHNWKLGV